MDKYCYFCGKKATSREHIPAKCFFYNNNSNLVTVPSCDKHNLQKSDNDSYARDFISMHRSVNHDGITKFRNKTVRSIRRDRNRIKTINECIPVTLNGRKSRMINIDIMTFDTYFNHLFSGLFYIINHKSFKSDWDIFHYSLYKDNMNNYRISGEAIEILKQLHSSNEFINIPEFVNHNIFKASYLIKKSLFHKRIILRTTFFGGFISYSFGKYR